MRLWMCDITFAGRIWRYGSVACRVELETLQDYRDGLVIDWVERFAPGAEIESQTFAQELVWPELCAYEGAGLALEGATFTLWVADTQTPHVRTCMLTGQVRGVEWGSEQEPVRLNLVAEPRPVDWPSAPLTLSSAHWSSSGSPPTGVLELEAAGVGLPYTIPVGWTPLLPGNVGVWPLTVVTQAGVVLSTNAWTPAKTLTNGTIYPIQTEALVLASNYPVRLYGNSGSDWTLTYDRDPAQLSNGSVKVQGYGAYGVSGSGMQGTLMLKAEATGELSAMQGYVQEAWLAWLLDPQSGWPPDGTEISAVAALKNPWTGSQYCSDTDLATSDASRWTGVSVEDFQAVVLKIPRYQIEDEIQPSGEPGTQVDVVCEDTRRLRYTSEPVTFFGSVATVPAEPYSLLHANPIRLSIALLHRSGVAFDEAAWVGLEEQFADWKMGFWLPSEPQNLLRVCQDQLWRWLPLQVTMGGLGLTPRLWNPDATALVHLLVGNGVERLAPLRRAGRDIYNSHCLRFNRSWQELEYPYRSVLAMGPHKNSESVPWVQESYARYGQRDYALTESDAIRGTATVGSGAAWGWLLWRSRYHCTDPVRMALRVDEHVPDLRAGVVVEVTDVSLGWTKKRCLLVEVRMLETGYEVLAESLDGLYTA